MLVLTFQMGIFLISTDCCYVFKSNIESFVDYNSTFLCTYVLYFYCYILYLLYLLCFTKSTSLYVTDSSDIYLAYFGQT